VGYSGEIIEDKIKSGLNSSLQHSWATIQNKLENVATYMGSLLEFAHQIENDDQFEKHHTSHRSSNPGKSSGGKKKEKEEKKNEKGKEHVAWSSSQKENKLGKNYSTGFKDKDKELKGIPKALWEERRKTSGCLKCHNGGHSWYNCYIKKPVTR
jgi:hypothetical protein